MNNFMNTLSANCMWLNLNAFLSKNILISVISLNKGVIQTILKRA